MKTDGTRWLRLNVATDNKCTQMTSISDFNDYISPLVYCGWGKGGRRERERERKSEKGKRKKREEKNERDEEELHGHRFRNTAHTPP